MQSGKQNQTRRNPVADPVHRRLSVLLAAILLLLCIFGTGAAAEKAADKTGTAVSVKAEQTENTQSYSKYYAEVSDRNKPEIMVKVGPDKAQNGKMERKTTEGSDSIVLSEEGSWAEWIFEVPEAGLYSVFPDYYPLEGTGKDILLTVSIDGKLPYFEASDFSLSRIWNDRVREDGKTIVIDSAGNDCRPEQIETPKWHSAGFRDILGLYEEPYVFYLEAGAHSIRFTVKRECLAVRSIEIGNQKQAISYEEYLEQYNDSNYAKSEEPIRLEAENAAEKNSSILYPNYDQANPATLPNKAGYIKINSIGGNNWSTPGDYISWKVDIPQDGLYQLAFRARQSYNEGLNSYRKLYINGKVPFREAENIVFPYKQQWYIKKLGDDNPLYVYLKKGDIITLECSSSVMSAPLREIQEEVLNLNNIYRSIIMITGTSPDIYHDYNLEEQIPTLVESMYAAGDRLEVTAGKIMAALGKNCSEAATIKKTIKIVRELADDTFFITERLGSLKSSVESISSLLLTLGDQPLELDCLYFIPQGQETPAANAGFFAGFVYGFKRFLFSFTNDYSQISASAKGESKAINVWAGVGRDQAQIISRLVDENFTAETDIPVIVNLVTGDSVLIKATLANKGPDVALAVQQVTPVNLAARGALVDLRRYDLSRLEKEMYSSAWTPFTYNGGIYAVPETMSCDVMFYRTDIFASLGLEPPQTWDEFYIVMEALQSKNLQVAWPEINSGLNNQGISFAIGTFDKFLFQNGGTYYNDNLSKTMFDTETAYQAFERTVELYRIFGLSREVSFFNRFRSGEAPLGIASYATFTQFAASAPELRGLWSFAPIPGTPDENGNINRAESGAVTGSVMMAAAKERGVDKEAFAFLDWWSCSETQVKYGKELEGILGVIGRIVPSNRNALFGLGWTKEELEVIDTQLQAVINPPQVLGNYLIARSLTSAIRGSINDKNTPRRSLDIYNRKINDEIERKRREFHLD